MKKNTLFLVSALFLVFYTSCDKKTKEDSDIFIKPELLDSIFTKKYDATLPCPDCDGIETSIKFFKDSTMVRTIYYDGKSKFPETYNGKWKLKDSVFIASFDNEKLFYKIKNAQTIMRVGSDLKDIKGDLKSQYTFKSSDILTDDLFLGTYVLGDTISTHNRIQIFKTKQDIYTLNFIGTEVKDSLKSYCQFQLNGKINDLDRLSVNLNKLNDTINGRLSFIFIKNNMHAFYEDITVDKVPKFCKEIPTFSVEGTYKKTN